MREETPFLFQSPLPDLMLEENVKENTGTIQFVFREETGLHAHVGHPFLQFIGRLPNGNLARRDRHRFTRPRISSRPRSPLLHFESSKTPNLDILAADEGVRNRLEHTLNNQGRIGLRQTGHLGNFIHDIRFCHLHPPFGKAVNGLMTRITCFRCTRRA